MSDGNCNAGIWCGSSGNFIIRSPITGYMRMKFVHNNHHLKTIHTGHVHSQIVLQVHYLGVSSPVYPPLVQVQGNRYDVCPPIASAANTFQQ